MSGSVTPGAGRVILTIIVMVICGGMIMIALRMIAANRKGHIKITLARGVYSLGDTVTGTLTLTVKEPLAPEDCFVRLAATRTVRRTDGARHRSEVWQYTDEITLPDNLQPGQQKFDFTLYLPDASQLDGGMGDQIDAFTQSLGGIGQRIGQIAKTGLKGQLDWEITAELRVLGVDLIERRDLIVNNQVTAQT